jgi:trans-2,3-dihydro-3-hydroxyanthranilate isomerase
MARPYAILDVFTETALAGNPLAVVRDGGGLSDAAMQKIAGEFNLSETVFVLPPEQAAHTARVRIFTPARELPFAGHPTVGAAVLLAADRFGAVASEREAVIVLEETIGLVRCGVVVKPGGAGYAEFDVPRKPAPVAAALDREAIAAALGLLPREIGFENHVPSAFEAGVPFAFVPVHDLDAVGRARPVGELWDAAFGNAPSKPAYVYCRETVRHEAAFHARMFAPSMGIAEDPATGAAAAAFAGAVHRFDRPTEGRHVLPIEQGVEMGRPSLVRLEIEVTGGGALHSVRIGGAAVVVAEGSLFV